MATFVTQSVGKSLLDAIMGAGSYVGPSSVKVALFTVAPTEVAGTGTELTGGGYARALLSSSAAVNGSSGRTAQRTSSAALLFTNMPVASTAVVGIALCSGDDDSVLMVNDSWTPGATFAVGDNYTIPSALLTGFFAKA